MAYEIVFSLRAMDDYFEIVHYLRNKFSEKEVNEFDKLLDEKIDFISSHPLAFAMVNDYDANLRKCIINQLTVVYYDVYDSRIEILTLFDGRKNPAELNLFG